MQRRFALLLVLATAAGLLDLLQPSAGAGRSLAYPDPLPTPSSDKVAQISFIGPPGMRVRWDVAAPGRFDSEPLICPARHDFPLGSVHRLMFDNIPGHAGLVLFPALDLAPPLSFTIDHFQSNALPVWLFNDDLDRLAAGEFMTVVIYVPDREIATDPDQTGVEALSSTRLDPGLDPIIEADKRGIVLAVVRITARP